MLCLQCDDGWNLGSLPEIMLAPEIVAADLGPSVCGQCLWLTLCLQGTESLNESHSEDACYACAGRTFCEKRHLPPSRLLCSGKWKRLVVKFCVILVLHRHASLWLPADLVPSAAVESSCKDV